MALNLNTMTKPSLRILKELLWLAITFIAAILICYLLFDSDPRGVVLNLQMHDTYFVISRAIIILPVFLLLTFVLYFIKEIRNKFSRTVPNTIVLVSGLLLIIFLVFVNKSLIVLGINSGWTAYPPLPMMPESAPEGPKLNPFAGRLVNAFTVLQILVTVALLYATFQWGRSTKPNKQS